MDDTPNTSDTANIVYAMGVLTVLAIVILGPGSFLMALGAGLTSTDDHPVPTLSNVLWAVAGFSFIAILLAYIAVVRSRERLTGVVLGVVIVAAGLAFDLGVLANVRWDISELSDATFIAWIMMTGPILSGLGVIGLALMLPKVVAEP